ncbi:hypothetical protein ABPG74_016508 [Tetrahymena malaccensis]
MNYQKYQYTEPDCSNKKKKNNNLDTLLNVLNSKNPLLNNQDQYSTINSDLSETIQIQNQTFNARGYGKSLLDQFVQQKQIQQSTAKINKLLFKYAFSQLKQYQPIPQKLSNSVGKSSQKSTLNCFKTPTRENIQARTFNTSEQSYQISTGYTDNLLHEDILRKDQMSTKNFKEIHCNQKEQMIEEHKVKLNTPESVKEDLEYQIKILNDQFKQDSMNAIQIQKSVEQEKIKQLKEELLLHQQDNDMLNDQISELRYQNVILSEKVQEYEKLIKNKSQNQSDLLQRIKEQQQMIDEKTNKNIELQNQLSILLKKAEDAHLQRQNENLRQDNQVLFQEKELSLCIIKQLEQKFDEENARHSHNFAKQQSEFVQKEKQFLFKIQELENQLKQAQKLLQEKSLFSKNLNDHSQKLQIFKQKNSYLAFKLINTFFMRKLLVPFQKIKQTTQERATNVNHRSIIRSQSKSPVNRSANKKDLSPIREKTYIERRRMISFGIYLFKKYKKVMIKTYFSRLKQLNNLQIQKELAASNKKTTKKLSNFATSWQTSQLNCRNNNFMLGLVLQMQIDYYTILDQTNCKLYQKWRMFTENQGVKEQANHESESIQEKQNNFNQEIYNFLRSRIDLEKYENQMKQRQAQKSLEKVYSIKMTNINNFESTQSFAIPQKSQIENNNQEWSFRDNKQLYQLNSNNFSLKNLKKDNYNQKNLYLNEYDLNQENMLYSNDIYKKNLSSRSCKSHISSQNSNKSQKSIKSQQRHQNGGEKSPCISYSDQLLQTNIQNKYLYTDSNKNSSLHNEGYINSSDQSIYSETVQEQRNFYK